MDLKQRKLVDRATSLFVHGLATPMSSMGIQLAIQETFSDFWSILKGFPQLMQPPDFKEKVFPAIQATILIFEFELVSSEVYRRRWHK